MIAVMRPFGGVPLRSPSYGTKNRAQNASCRKIEAVSPGARQGIIPRPHETAFNRSKESNVRLLHHYIIVLGGIIVKKLEYENGLC